MDNRRFPIVRPKHLDMWVRKHRETPNHPTLNMSLTIPVPNGPSGWIITNPKNGLLMNWTLSRNGKGRSVYRPYTYTVSHDDPRYGPDRQHRDPTEEEDAIQKKKHEELRKWALENPSTHDYLTD
jgi:hypothetical protein